MEGDPQQNEGSGPRSLIQAPVRKVKKQLPQVTVDQFWTKFNTAFPGKVDKVLPKDNTAKAEAANAAQGPIHCEAAGKSYEEAAAECVAAVEKIATECRRVNLKYRDPHFDIEWDLKRGRRNCLDGLLSMDWDLAPRSVKRVSVRGVKVAAHPKDVNADLNSTFLTSLFSIKKAQLPVTCAREQTVIVGFCRLYARSGTRRTSSTKCAFTAMNWWACMVLCFTEVKSSILRIPNNVLTGSDGEWIQTIIDDKLYLTAPDFDENSDQQYTWQQQINMQDPEEEYRKTCQSGSRALYFAQCSSENETWLPLLEKAYAKAHGDFNAIQGGFTGFVIINSSALLLGTDHSQ